MDVFKFDIKSRTNTRASRNFAAFVFVWSTNVAISFLSSCTLSIAMVLSLSWFVVSFQRLTTAYQQGFAISRQRCLVKASARGPWRTAPWTPTGAEGSGWETLFFSIAFLRVSQRIWQKWSKSPYWFPVPNNSWRSDSVSILETKSHLQLSARNSLRSLNSDALANKCFLMNKATYFRNAVLNTEVFQRLLYFYNHYRGSIGYYWHHFWEVQMCVFNAP